MRKLSFLFLFAALSLVSTTTFAQEVQEEVKAVQQEMVEVKLSELPEAVTKTLGETYAGFTAEKALMTKKDDKVVYYIKLQKEGEYSTVLIDAEGKVIEQKEEKQ